MKKSLIVLTASIALFATPMMAEDTVVVSTASPTADLTPGLIAAGIAITVIGIAALDSGSGT